jgi:uncharacterized DUF497 family protein
LNIANHGYDFADIEEVFDGRFLLTRQDSRRDYGELRVQFPGRVQGTHHQHHVHSSIG